MTSKRIVGNVASNIFDVKLFMSLVFNVAKDLAKSIGKTAVEATFLLEAREKDLVQLDEQVFVTLLARGHASS